MNNKALYFVKQNRFTCALISALTICISGTAYCIIYGQRLASTHLEPVAPAFYQGIMALIIAAIFLLVKPIRTRPKWYIIPIMLFATCFLYEYVVSFYPCCVGA